MQQRSKTTLRYFSEVSSSVALSLLYLSTCRAGENLNKVATFPSVHHIDNDVGVDNFTHRDQLLKQLDVARVGVIHLCTTWDDNGMG